MTGTVRIRRSEPDRRKWPEPDRGDPASELWPKRRAGLRAGPGPVWLLVLRRVAGVLGLLGLGVVALDALRPDAARTWLLDFLALEEWNRAAVALPALLLLAAHGPARPPSRWNVPFCAVAAGLSFLGAAASMSPSVRLSLGLLTVVLPLIAATYLLMCDLSFAAREPRHAHLLLHLNEAAMVVLAGLLAISASNSGKLLSAIGYALAFAMLLGNFPNSIQFPERPLGWQWLRLALLGVALAVAVDLYLNGYVVCWIAGVVLAVAALVGAVGTVRGLVRGPVENSH